MDMQEGHSTALSGAETMDRRGVWVRKPMFEADWEDTSAWAAYSEAAMSVSDSNPPVTEGSGNHQGTTGR